MRRSRIRRICYRITYAAIIEGRKPSNSFDEGEMINVDQNRRKTNHFANAHTVTRLCRSVVRTVNENEPFHVVCPRNTPLRSACQAGVFGSQREPTRNAYKPNHVGVFGGSRVGNWNILSVTKSCGTCVTFNEEWIPHCEEGRQSTAGLPGTAHCPWQLHITSSRWLRVC